MEESQYNITFNRNKAEIHPVESQPIYQTTDYYILRTQFPEYFIKIYTIEDYNLNIKQAKNFSQSTTRLNKVTDHIVSIYDIKDILPEVGVLMEAYQYNLEQLIENRLIITNLDVLKLIYQLCCWIDWLKEAKIEGVFLNTDNIVMDSQLNFRLTHFDKNVNEISEEDREAISSEGLPKAPEFRTEAAYDHYSNVWELGTLIYRLMTMRLPKFDEENEWIKDNTIDKVDTVFVNIMQGCFKVNKGDRLAADDIMEIIMYYIDRMQEFSLTPLTTSSKKALEQYTNFRHSHVNTELDDAVLEVFDGKLKRKNDIFELLHYLLDENHILHSESLQQLIKIGWGDPRYHIQVYEHILEIATENVNNKVVICKTLLVLHSYIHRGSKKALIIVESDNKEKNMFLNILDKILKVYSPRAEHFISGYAHMLLLKFEFLYLHIKLVNNNLSINKINFITKWSNYTHPAFVSDLYNYFQLVFAFFVRIKQYKVNYFTKNIVLLVCKEFHGVLSLFINTLVLLKFISVFHPDIDEVVPFDNLVHHLVGICENHRKVFDLYLAEVSHETPSFNINILFSVNKDLVKEFSQMCYNMRSRKQAYVNERGKLIFTITEFTKNFLNHLIKLPEAPDYMENERRKSTENQYAKEISLINTQWINFASELTFPEMTVLRALDRFPEKKNNLHLRFDLSYATANKLEEAVLSHRVISVNTPVVGNQVASVRVLDKEEGKKPEEVVAKVEIPDLPVPNKVTIDVGVQNDIIEEERKLKEMKKEIRKMERESQKAKKKQETKKREETVTVDIAPSELSAEIFDVLTLERFILNEFKETIQEWIVDFAEINFKTKIDTTERYKMYKGVFKNYSVCIREFVLGKNTAKYIKEIKREIGLLISLPAHPSLVTLIGLTINDGSLYLLTEFCEGGSLFKMIHNHSLGYQLG